MVGGSVLTLMEARECHKIGREQRYWDLLPTLKWRMKIAASAQKSLFAKTVAATSEILKPPPSQKDVDRKLKARLIYELEKGIERGIGYLMPRSLQDKPIPIPAEAWAGEVDWENNELRGAGLHFVGVRIRIPTWSLLLEKSGVVPSPMPELANALCAETEQVESNSGSGGTVSNPLPTAIEPPSKGRPSDKDALLEAMRRLPLDYKISAESQVEAIRQLALIILDGKPKTGLKRKTILKYIAEFKKGYPEAPNAI